MNSETKRLKEILSIIKKHNLLSDKTPNNIRETIEELGPTFIKMGQILSSRNDIIPEKYTTELKKLRGSVSPTSFEQIKEQLTLEYGDISDIFESIEEKPLGSASIAQTHLGKLKTGETVAIKIQRKDIYQMMTLDAKLLKTVISLLHIDKMFSNIINVKAVIDEMYETAKEEMDFLIEAKHIEEFAENNKDIEYMKPLKVYKNISTPTILVMEYVDGNFINEKEELNKKGYDMIEISNKLASNYIKQAIDDGYYHADPHADNIKIIDGKICYLDFGMMGRLSSKNKDLLNKCLVAILKNDVTEIEHILTTLNTSNNQIDYMLLAKDIRKILEKNKTTEISNIDIKEFANDMFELLNTNHITLPKDISMLVRGIVVIEGVLEEINPNISLLEVLKNRMKKEKVLTKENIEKNTLNIIENGKDLIEIPHETLTFLKGINNGELRFNIEMNDSKKQMDRLENLFHQAIITVLDLAVLIGISIMIVLEKEPSFVLYMYIVLAIIFTTWLFLKMFKSKIKKNK